MFKYQFKKILKILSVYWELSKPDITFLVIITSFFGYYAGICFIDDPIQDTWYIVEAIDSNGCISLEDINVIVDSCNVSSINNNIDNIFNVYPNPSKGKFNIIINNLNDYDKILVLNSLGNIVYYNNNLESNINLDLSDNEIGVYYLVLFGENKHVVRKIFLLK